MDKALITAMIGIALWAATRVYDYVLSWRKRRDERSNLIRNLYAEVDFNTRDLEFFLENSANVDAISVHLRENADALPHITDAHHTVIYTTRIPDLHYLDHSLTSRLVLFYGLLDKIKAQIDGINQPSFSKISAEGKITVIRRLITAVRECQREGEAILTLFSQAYSSETLTRHSRRFVDTKQP